MRPRQLAAIICQYDPFQNILWRLSAKSFTRLRRV